MNIMDIEKYAWFSNLAYVKWNADSISKEDKMVNAVIKAERAPESNGKGLATKIFKDESWKVENFIPNDDEGFAASLYTNGSEKVLAIRGTEVGLFDWQDLLGADINDIGKFRGHNT